VSSLPSGIRRLSQGIAASGQATDQTNKGRIDSVTDREKLMTVLGDAIKIDIAVWETDYLIRAMRGRGLNSSHLRKIADAMETAEQAANA
jgi:hypothetical protein